MREIGHFAAHRGERDRGVGLERAEDMQTSARRRWMQMQGRPTADHMREPVTTSVPVFETSLPTASHCEPELLGPFGPSTPAEIEGDRIVAIR